jgi:ABC-type Mn2+/Zn2+ transport system ATPase subunit
MNAAPRIHGRLEVRDLTVSYDGVVALRRANFACGPGEVVGIVGPNGAGKSTLLKVIVGLIRADAGEVSVDGRPVAQVRRHVAYLPQRSEVDWDYPAVVEEVVAMGRYPHVRLLGRLGAAHRAKVREALERVGMSALARRSIGALSGGQQQRMLLGRALAQEARILLLDEPFAGVDALTEQVLWARIRDLRADGATVLVVNHDLGMVTASYDSVLVLSGTVVAFGPVEEVLTAPVIAHAYGAVPMLRSGR